MKGSLLIFLFVLFSACASKKSSALDKPEVQESAEVEYVFLARGACYGTCPNYDVTIYANGNVVYNGKTFVDHIGAFKGEMSQDKVDRLFTRVNGMEWTSYPEEYPIDNYDFPQWRLTVGNASFVKKIKGNTRAASELIELTDLISQLIEDVELSPAD